VLVIDLATMDVVASVAQPGPAYADEGTWISQSRWIDDRRLVVGSPSGRLLVWAPANGKIVRRLNDPPAPGTDYPYAAQVTPGGAQLVVAATTLMAYDLATGARSWPEPKQAGSAIAVDPLAGVVWAQESGPGSSRLFAYDLVSGERAGGELNGQHGTVCDASVSPDGSTLAVSSCNEGAVALWALDGASVTGSSLESSGWASSEDLWSPDGIHVAMFRPDDPSAVEVVDVRDGSRQRARGVVASASNSPVFRSDGVLQTVDDRNRVVEFDPGTGRTRDTGIVLPGGQVTANVAVDGPHRSAYGLDDGTVVVVDTARGRIVRTIKTDLVGVYGLGWSADGRRLFAAGQSEHAEVLDVATSRKTATLPRPAANLVVSADGDLLATAAFDGTIRFFDPATLEQVGSALSGGTAFAAQIQLTPDGRTLITSGLDNSMRLFDVASRRQIGVPLDIASWGAAISPDSTEIAVTTAQGVGLLAIDRADLLRAACRSAGRDLTAAEWVQYVGGDEHRICPSSAGRT
jgi:WD40 repeat protein